MSDYEPTLLSEYARFVRHASVFQVALDITELQAADLATIFSVPPAQVESSSRTMGAGTNVPGEPDLVAESDLAQRGATRSWGGYLYSFRDTVANNWDDAAQWPVPIANQDLFHKRTSNDVLNHEW